MLDIKFIRENPEQVKQGALNKGANVDIDRILELDEKRRALITRQERLRAEQKKLGKDDIEKAKILKEEQKPLIKQLSQVEKEYDALMGQVPNLAFNEVPVGKDDKENKHKEFGKVKEKPKFNFAPKEHWQLGEKLDIIDTERAAKVAGARFYYLKGQGALLEFALINFALDKIIKKGFTFVIPPVMIKSEMAKATGYFEQTDAREAYYLKEDDLFLVGTSEQSLITMHAQETFEQKDLPKMYLGFSPCFRREAGSYGKDTKGILRVHQFDKLEMVVLCKPEDSAKYHSLLLEIEQELMDELGLHYQVIDICTGDLGLPAAKKYDLEVWLPGQNQYRETHSTSNCTDFQSRRLNIKYKNDKGESKFVHILNGTAFSMRPLIAILENYQQESGAIKMPKVLHKYLGFDKIEF
ncbi:serine--tRNA ligase [bacterium (Candidatus Gribaldobacteria) CG23_combo_of_CG06-09_8_20_14_all_37_87_8]|uniref:Serine--tRNA ligase n=2 Tax=Candidatus Gribaldobacteria TaxID=2798536 RepID=A0A2G9ZG91_9BACT|nr:MAG: serine--tRNA ligase [Parcubacteria group bacterium CG1_02_37_13]PIP31358.1 MAG: serine--tRNA ligase [bacterium (Candidatus Gribaldobacteria) CG23_combo_of_CG06-09_8_20_14_all_37_87_8]PIR90026.1 MAG: serine--tRNA ligase [bacterium (Candidatus Gribaldobacteria) CG10_big_fil_rev_8_21_14_0_10_37_21]